CLTGWNQWLPWRDRPKGTIVCRRVLVLRRRFAQFRLHRIEFDVVDDAVKLNFIAHPMVIRLVLPECSLSSQEPVARVGREALQPVHHHLAGCLWRLGFPRGRLPACRRGRDWRGRLEACPTDYSSGLTPLWQGMEDPVQMAGHDHIGQ